MKLLLLVLPFLWPVHKVDVGPEKELEIYIFLAEECPICIYMAKPMREVVKQHYGNARFVAVFPNQKSTFATSAEFIETYQLQGFEIVLDPNQALTKELGATVTPEVVIVEKKANKIMYRGRISNAYLAPGRMRHGKRTNDLLQCLDSWQNNRQISEEWSKAVGCFITFK